MSGGINMKKMGLACLQKLYNFTITEDLLPALQKLETLAVSKYRNDDYSYQDSFDKIWRSVLHEVDLYEEGEESQLTKNAVRGAKNWLKAYSHLCKEIIPAEYR